MADAPEDGSPDRAIGTVRRRLVMGAAVCWVFVVAASGTWLWRAAETTAIAMAAEGARQAFARDVTFRRWATSHGGVYVPVSDTTPPNPYLTDVPRRDVTTTDGLPLTLVNPAFMMRQVYEIGRQAGVRSHITSAQPIRPENGPDPWEAQALVSLQTGFSEVSELVTIDGAQHLRLMKPLVTEKGCLKCHAAQGYREGDLRGGISVAVPFERYAEAVAEARERLVGFHVLIGGLGLVGLALGNRALKRAEEQQANSERASRAMFDHMTPGAFRQNADGRLTDANPSLLRMFGVTRDEFLSRTTENTNWDVVHEDGRPFTPEEYPSVVAIRTGQPLSGVVMGLLNERTGERFWAEVDAVPEFRPGEASAHQALVTLHDITSRRDAQRKLRESEERFALAFHTSPYAIVVSRLADGLILDVNEAFCSMSGHSREEAIGRSALALNLWPCVADREHMVATLRAKGEVIDREQRFRTRDGRDLMTVLSARIATIGGGLCIFASIADVTVQRRTEERYQTLFREMLDGFALHDIVLDEAGRPVDYRFIAVNPAFESLTGLKAGDIVGRTVREVLPGVESHWIQNYGKVVSTGEPAFFENRVEALDKHFEVSAFRTGPGQFACVFVDVTERKRAEAERQRLLNQLAQAQKMESIGRLAGGVAHDFNNMLGVILGHAELALAQVQPTDPIRSDLEAIHSTAVRSGGLTRQLLAFARRQTVSPRVLDLRHTIGGMLEMLRRLIGEDIALDWQPASELWSVRLDPSQVDQVLANLCVNARDAMPHGGTIRISVRNTLVDASERTAREGVTPGPFVLLSVEDTGSGMDEQTLAQLFEPFFTTKDVGRGTGLGLATVYGIVKQNHGFIDVHSVPGCGSRFDIYLPTSAVGTSAEVTTPQASPRGQRETILLVEDDQALLVLAQTLLESLGYRVLSANHPAQAERLVADHGSDIDLLMTDVVMPGMNGRDLARALLGAYPRMKCLFTSGYTADIIATHGVLDENVPFLQKPYSTADLASALRRLLGRDAPTVPA